ncbi:hypothetical protein D9M72_652790 [compost metagenome]
MGGAGDAIALAAEELLEQFADAVVVVDDQQMPPAAGGGDGARAAAGARIDHAHCDTPRDPPLTLAGDRRLTDFVARETFFNGLRSFRRS